jgi:hypothetical protein
MPAIAGSNVLRGMAQSGAASRRDFPISLGLAYM